MKLATYLSPIEFNEIMEKSPIAYVPFGTVEWHGPHLPLGVDTLKIEALVARAIKISGGIVFPTVTWNRNSVREVDGREWEGVENKCQQLLPGNIHFLCKETFENLLKDIVSSCIKRGFKVVCIWSGHNAGHLNRDIPAMREYFNQKYPDRRIHLIANDAELVPHQEFEKRNIDIRCDHAGKWETSIMMASHPDLVNLKALEGRDLSNSKLCVSDNGVQDSTAELGEQLLNLCSTAVGRHNLRLLEEMKGVEVEIPQPMPGAYD